MAAVNMPDVAWQKKAVGARHRSLFERRFQLEKAAPKLFNRSCSALFFS
jgi:hypothetical protein